MTMLGSAKDPDIDISERSAARLLLLLQGAATGGAAPEDGLSYRGRKIMETSVEIGRSPSSCKRTARSGLLETHPASNANLSAGLTGSRCAAAAAACCSRPLLLLLLLLAGGGGGGDDDGGTASIDDNCR